jgi:hypothetical protein
MERISSWTTYIGVNMQLPRLYKTTKTGALTSIL